MSQTYSPDIDDEFEDGEAPPDDQLPPEGAEAGDEYEPSGEDQARALGWKPLHEFKGEPRLWRDWPEFLQHGYEDPRVLRENNQKLTQKTARLERQLAEARAQIGNLEGQVGEVLALTKQNAKATLDQRKAALDQQRRAAVRDGDESAFEQVEAELRAIEQAPAPKPPEPAAPKFHPAITEFIEANPWWATDMELQKAMVAHYGAVQISRKDLDIEDQLQLAKQRLEADFPDKFGAPPVPPRRQAPPAPRRSVADVGRPTGGPALPPRQRQASGFEAIADLKERQEAREAYASARRADPGMTEAEYLTLYNNPHADPLELRRLRRPA